MKKQSDVQNRLRTLLVAEIDRRVADVQRRLPHRCVHNHRQPLDARRVIEDEPNEGYNRLDRTHLPVVKSIGLCMLGAESPESWNGTICEDPIDAQRCSDFTASLTKAQILEDFLTQLRDPGWVETHHPAIFTLLWVLEDTLANYHLPWWKRLVYKFLRLRTEPVRTQDVLKLLPPGGLN